MLCLSLYKDCLQVGLLISFSTFGVDTYSLAPDRIIPVQKSDAIDFTVAAPTPPDTALQSSVSPAIISQIPEAVSSETLLPESLLLSPPSHSLPWQPIPYNIESHILHPYTWIRLLMSPSVLCESGQITADSDFSQAN